MLKLLIILCLISSAQAANHMAFLGGSGDPAGETTIFDHKIGLISQYVRRAEARAPVNVEVAFDGGHSTTERLLQENFPGETIRQFNPTSFESIISRYEAQMRDGSIRSGDQLMVVVDTHGAEPLPNQATHSVAAGLRSAGSLLSLSGGNRVSLDRLQNLARLAEEKGVKLAILDYSCHSGASIPLGNSRTCVITASGPQSFAYGGASSGSFSNAMTSRMIPGKNLEQVFLEARTASNDMGFPMISTTEGDMVQDLLYPILMKYINGHELTDDKFAPEIISSVTTNSCLAEEGEVEKLMKLSRELEQSQSNLRLQGFRDALTAYAAYRKTLQDRLRSTGAGVMDETRQVCGTNNNCPEVRVRDIMAMNPDQMITQYQGELSRAWNPEARARAQNMIAYYQSAKRIRDEIRRTNPQAGSFQTVFNVFPEITRKTQELARNVAVESRKLYNSLYLSGQDNPCRNFTL